MSRHHIMVVKLNKGTDMEFAGINYLAIVVAAVAGFMVGGVWYNVFGNAWAHALGKTKEDFKPHPKPFIIAIISQLIMAFVLSGVIGHVGEPTLFRGVISGLMIWAGFVATSLATNHAFQQTKLSLTLIDSGHWLVVLLVMGAIIGAFGV